MAFNLSQAIESGLRLYASRLSESLTSKGSVASGKLGESIEVRVPNPRRGEYIGQVLMLDYWEAVDIGRKAGKRPPIQSIIDWLKYPAVQDRFTFGKGNISDQSKLPSIAFAIAKKIGDKGTKGNNFATEVFESRLTDDLRDRISDAVENDLNGTIEELNRIMNE
jgi:hypothetical protein